MRAATLPMSIAMRPIPLVKPSTIGCPAGWFVEAGSAAGGTDIQVFFCDPQSPRQRGSDENTNGPRRQYMLKGVDISGYSQLQLNAIARQLNERPRKTLGFKTPAEMFSESVALTG